MTARVSRTQWSFNENAPKEPAIRITRGKVFLCVPMTEIRLLVDKCHDRADEHDREQREAANNVN